MRGLSENAIAVGQVSADGQFRWDGVQWVTIPRGTREPTPWTRPMQLGAAGLLAGEAVLYLAATILFVTHDTVKQALAAQGTQVPPNMSEDTYLNFIIGTTIAFVAFFSALELFGAIGAYLRWRWAFWYVLVLMALGGLNAIFNAASLARPSATNLPVGVLVIQELLCVGALAMFIWMLIGAVRYGPWAMKRPGPG